MSFEQLQEENEMVKHNIKQRNEEEKEREFFRRKRLRMLEDYRENALEYLRDKKESVKIGILCKMNSLLKKKRGKLVLEFSFSPKKSFHFLRNSTSSRSKVMNMT